jgi:hypothetical protein
MAVIEPEEHAKEEERRHEHEKDQCGFQNIAHGKTSFPRGDMAARSRAVPTFTCEILLIGICFFTVNGRIAIEGRGRRGKKERNLLFGSTLRSYAFA